MTPAADPGYHRLISVFHAATGVPMVLNTSFNTVRTLLGEEGKNGMRSSPSFPQRAGPVRYETTFTVGLGDDGAVPGDKF